MTTDTHTDRSPTSEEEFEDELGDLLDAAHDNGVDVEGGWVFRHADDRPDWGVEIYPVTKMVQ